MKLDDLKDKYAKGESEADAFLNRVVSSKYTLAFLVGVLLVALWFAL